MSETSESIRLLKSEQEISDSFALMLQLRPALNQQHYVEAVKRMQQTQSYQLVAVFAPQLVALAGFRVAEWLHSGKYLEIEELITDANVRSNGYGAKLFDWVCEHARAQQCNQLRLVSGVNRVDAHRFYLTRGMKFEAKYFSLDL